MLPLALICAAFAFMVSASAGFGGSLILVPALSLLLGPKEGIALATLLLVGNNIAKVIAYRRTLSPLSVVWVLPMTVIGSAIGAGLLVAAPDAWVNGGVISVVILSFAVERMGKERLQRMAAPVLALASGATSGFAGTSGPLKGIVLRNLRLDRLHLVGAASLVSLAGDAAKLGIFTGSSLLRDASPSLVLASVPLMLLAAYAGRHVNNRVGERAYAVLFWVVMAGYSVRLLF